MTVPGGPRASVHPAAGEADAAAADCLAEWLASPGTRTVMLAAGNTPLDLYRRIGERRLDLSHVQLFALDEYVGVPLDEPRRIALDPCLDRNWRMRADPLGKGPDRHLEGCRVWRSGRQFSYC